MGQEPEQAFLQSRRTNGRHHEKMLNLTHHQMKTTTRCRLTAIGVAPVTRTDSGRWGEMWRSRNARALAASVGNGAAVARTSVSFLRKLQNRITTRSSDPSRRIHYCNISHNKQQPEATQMSISGWLHRTDVVYTHTR